MQIYLSRRKPLLAFTIHLKSKLASLLPPLVRLSGGLKISANRRKRKLNARNVNARMLQPRKARGLATRLNSLPHAMLRFRNLKRPNPLAEGGNSPSPLLRLAKQSSRISSRLVRPEKMPRHSSVVVVMQAADCSVIMKV